MIDVLAQWINRQLELGEQIRAVRDTLPGHVRNPDPGIYRSNNYVALDFETTTVGNGLAVYPDNRIVLAAWELGPDHPCLGAGRSEQYGVQDYEIHRTGVRYKWGGEYDLGCLVRQIERADFIVCHNAKFELAWLARCGLDLAKVVVWCTQVGEYVIGGNRWQWGQLSLENSGQRRLGEGKINIISKLFKAGLCSTEIPASWLLDYCAQDVILCRKLFQAQREYMLKDGPLLPVMYTRCLLTPILADIENNGMYLDAAQVSQMCLEKELEYGQLQQKLEEVTGGINVNSPDQLAEYLYDTLKFEELRDHRGNVKRTGTGKRKTDKDTVPLLRARTDEQREFLELYKRHKELYNELTKYLRKFRDCCEEADGRLVGQFNQTNTTTHRLSSSGLDYKCQFQNFPRAYKPLFRARSDDWLVGEADGAQLEFRVAAHLGRDPVALDDITGGTDIHSVTASVIGCSRQDAKPHTFKPLYGGRSGTADEKRYYEFFREKYDSITRTQQSWIDTVLRDKELRTEWGLKYYWPDTKMERSGYVKNSTSICNYPVQALATAEIIPVGLVYFWHYVRALGLRMLVTNTVHDSIIVELPKDEVDWFHVISKVSLVDEVYDYMSCIYNLNFTVPLGAGVQTGSHWAKDGDGKPIEYIYNAEEDKYVSICE